jgi:hypothetical protein
MDGLKPPDELDITCASLAEEWRRWKQSWECYRLASGASERMKKFSVLFSYMWQDNPHVMCVIPSHSDSQMKTKVKLTF